MWAPADSGETPRRLVRGRWLSGRKQNGMRIIGTGHASIKVETEAGSILCDPWVNPAYFTSWFVFPENATLDWDELGNTDYLYVSHLHRDHFDAKNLAEHINKDAKVLLPEFPVDDMERELRELGFHDFIKCPNEEIVELPGGLRIMIQAMTAPNDGPLGDSSIWIEHNGLRVLNQNDARPHSLDTFKPLGHVHAHFLQYSGAIWYPMVYDLTDAARRAFGKQKRARQLERTLRYIEDLEASWVFPMAGPPCFLDDDLWFLNDIHGDEGNIFPDQQVFCDWLADHDRTNTVILLPGSVWEVTPDGLETLTTHPVEDVRAFFEVANKTAYLRDYQERMRPVLEAERASWAHPEIDLYLALKHKIEPIMAQADHMSAGIGGPVQFTLTGPQPPDGSEAEVLEEITFDFRDRTVRRPSPTDRPRYKFRTERVFLEHLVHIGEVDWVNSLFLSARFSAKRIGQYNEYVYTFFKCLDNERVNYVEGWYASSLIEEDEDIELGDWVVQRRCPHLQADLTRFGELDGDILTCMLHGWKFDLAKGTCLTSAGHEIEATRKTAEA